jgi:hypothetical protein
MLPMLMTLAGSSAVPARRNPGSSSCTIQNGDFRFRSSTRSHASAGKVSSGSPQVAPALLTRMSSAPEWARTSAARRAHSDRRDRSAATPRTGPNSASAVTAASTASALRELITTEAPACSSPRAIIIPIPLVPPVTRAVLPCSPNSRSR